MFPGPHVLAIFWAIPSPPILGFSKNVQFWGQKSAKKGPKKWPKIGPRFFTPKMTKFGHFFGLFLGPKNQAFFRPKFGQKWPVFYTKIGHKNHSFFAKNGQKSGVFSPKKWSKSPKFRRKSVFFGPPKNNQKVPFFGHPKIVDFGAKNGHFGSSKRGRKVPKMGQNHQNHVFDLRLNEREF